ncbi:protein vav isoform X2 [Spodoptera frugiperda]|uniref:Protein vav isoform X2 n=1 Tax=Spodoptera frugiperda TaxID=7108 RepID=A0A9R0EXY1_SPOFR|nr:protein vav isoform X2 [Spodoptera frugiperda]
MAAGGEDLWRECASWLTRCGLLRPDHKANWETSSIHDLAYTLRDGVLLCNLLNVLHPGCIDMKDVNQRPQMAQFLCMRNIKVFLRTCHEVFELRETDLFDPSMLFDLSNFHRVLCTLAKLSQCPKALAKNIKPFSALRTQSEEDIYKDLQSVSASATMAPPPYSSVIEECPGHPAAAEVPWVQFTIPSATCEDRVEEIYEDLCYVKFTSATPELATSSHSLEKRDYVIRELVDTENNYVDVLSKIIKYFLRPLMPYLKPQDMQVIFFGIKELHETHTGLLRQLKLATEACVPGNGAPRLADVFLAWRERLLLYGDYCSNLTNAQETLKNLDARDSTFSKQLAKCQKEHSDGRIQLRDILSVPMQRVLKYHLLLDKLVHETQPNHEEFRGLERAKEAMVDVAQYINEVKRDSEVLALLAKVQESIIDWEGGALGAGGAGLAAYGRLLLDGELKVKAHEDQKVRSRYVFVFDKLMLLCKPVKDNQYSYRVGVRLAEYRVEEGCGRRALRPDARWASHFYLVRRTKDATFTLYARTDDAKRKWVKAIRDAIDNLEPPGCRSTNHKFVLHTFEKPATCHHCSKFLKGRIFQGYLCTVCNACAHKECIALSGRCGGGLAPAPPLPPHHHAPDQALHYYMWYVGEMGRETATARLERRVDGTFLLRVRPHAAHAAHHAHHAPMHAPTDTNLALSLKTDNTVKHMRVCRKPIDQVQHYYLSESRFFRSVVELITYYEKTSLSENFEGLNSNLRWPFRRVVATVIHDFRPLESSQLALRPGAKVLVLSKEGDSRGWWKGRTLDKGDNRSGYFPKECVREEPECIGALD